ncbi:MAG: 50S ribosomal protein L9 [Alphaproteobacteria bacterium]|nr:MAG: 50S ribosomal protein L9 [Alphaproteobacteria bacterium]
MQIILLERVESLGQMGDIVKVRDGYARNFLLPQKKALRATDENRKLFEARRKDIEAENLKRRTQAEQVAAKLEGRTVVLLRQAGDSGQLYGSVSTRDIADALSQDGIAINRRQVVLDRPIKLLGMHDVRIVLHGEVSVSVQVNVARSEQEADLQAQGVDVTADLFEEEARPAALAEAQEAPEAAETAAAQGEDAPAN